MKGIGVFGLGYVGCVSAACLARQGHQVIGVDVHPVKVELINQGKSPIVENGLGEIIAAEVAAGRLRASLDAAAVVAQSEISLVCVGTPSRPNGSLDLQYIHNAVAAIGRALKDHTGYHAVVVRSTMLPGTVETVVVPLLEQESGKRAGVDFGVYLYPEFLREGTALDDYYHPAFTLIGSWPQCDPDLLQPLYQDIDARVLHTDVRTAEMVKYTSNAFHALKISFANEIGTLCKALQVDSHALMDIFVQDTHLNISPKYLRPGFAFGGSCLPKDLRALTYQAKRLDLETPVLNAILPSNALHIDHAFQLIQRTEQRKVGILGLSFKAGTDDLRESPMVQLVERLLGKGYDIRIYDNEVSMARLIGANRHYIEQVIPHISTLLVQGLDEILAHAEVLVLGKATRHLTQVLAQVRADQQVIDLVRAGKNGYRLNGNYQGICW